MLKILAKRNLRGVRLPILPLLAILSCSFLLQSCQSIKMRAEDNGFNKRYVKALLTKYGIDKGRKAYISTGQRQYYKGQALIEKGNALIAQSTVDTTKANELTAEGRKLVKQGNELKKISVESSKTSLEKWHLDNLANRSVGIGTAITAAERNEVIEDWIYLIDVGYDHFTTNLHNERATFNTFGDLVSLGMNSAGVLLNTPSTKTTLATLNAALGGAKLSVDTNYFRQLTTTALVRKMDELRTKQRNRILIRMKRPIDKYSFGMAMDDLLQYLQAGTILSALKDLTEEADKNLNTEKKLEDIIRAQADWRTAMRAVNNFKVNSASMEAQLESNLQYAIELPQLSDEDIQDVSATVKDKTEQIEAILNEVKTSDADNTVDTGKLIELLKNTKLDNQSGWATGDWQGKTTDDLKSAFQVLPRSIIKQIYDNIKQDGGS